MMARTLSDTTSSVSAAADGRRRFTIGAGTFLTAAAAIAIVQGIAPIDSGWWLVAFLGLVGGVSQWLLGAGLAGVALRAEALPGRDTCDRVRVALWNLGALVVAVMDLADSAVGVLVGSIVLLTALGLYGRGLREVGGIRHVTVLSAGYVALLAFLMVSVLIGAGLAGALPAP